MNSHFGLYFPYFHFPNDEWIKLAALYWDKMYRIVPYSVDTINDTDTVKKLMEVKFIDIVHPEDNLNELEGIKNDLQNLVENHQVELEKYYGIKNMPFWSNNQFLEKDFFKNNPDLTVLHEDKFGYGLNDYLLKRGLGMRVENGVALHPHLANVYMSALAEKLAFCKQSHPITNDETNFFAIGGYSFERLAQVLLGKAQITQRTLNEDELESCLAVIAVKAVMPKDIKQVSVEDIIKLRELHVSNLGKFQDFVQEVITELPNLKQVDGQEFIYDHLKTVYDKIIKEELKILDSAINSIGIETVPMLLNMQVKVPTLLTKGGLVAGLTLANPILGATAGVALMLLNIISVKREEIEKKLKDSDVSYLMQLRDALTPVASLDWFNIQSRKLLFGI